MADEKEPTASGDERAEPPTLQTLPAELRNRIYRIYIGLQTGFMEEVDEDGYERYEGANFGPALKLKSDNVLKRQLSGPSGFVMPPAGLRILPLAKTCHQICTEMMPLLIEGGTLVLSHNYRDDHWPLTLIWAERLRWSKALAKVQHAHIKLPVHHHSGNRGDERYSGLRSSLDIHADALTGMLSLKSRYVESVDKGEVELYGESKLLTVATWIEVNVVPDMKKCFVDLEECDHCGRDFAPELVVGRCRPKYGSRRDGGRETPHDGRGR